MSLHTDLLARLQRIARVQLVASLYDERLHFPHPGELHIFLPDLHLVTAARAAAAGYLYGTNHLPLLEAVVKQLADFRAHTAPAGEIVVYQLGDLLDLWRQVDGLDPAASAASAIQNDHATLLAALRDPALNTQFLLGNHDYDLYRFPSFDAWQRSFFVEPSVVVLHGDVFDWAERLPDELQNLALYLFSSSHPPSTADLAKMRVVNRNHGRGRRFRDSIQNRRPAPTGHWREPGGERQSWNVQVAGAAQPEMLLYLDSARARCAAGGRTLAVIGHTHHARIAVHDRDGEFFALMDCGAWIENCCTATDPAPRPNAQLGVLGANQACLYQLAPL